MRIKTKRRFFLIVILLLAPLAGCATMSAVGRDSMTAAKGVGKGVGKGIKSVAGFVKRPLSTWKKELEVCSPPVAELSKKGTLTGVRFDFAERGGCEATAEMWIGADRARLLARVVDKLGVNYIFTTNAIPGDQEFLFLMRKFKVQRKPDRARKEQKFVFQPSLQGLDPSDSPLPIDEP